MAAAAKWPMAGGIKLASWQLAAAAASAAAARLALGK